MGISEFIPSTSTLEHNNSCKYFASLAAMGTCARQGLFVLGAPPPPAMYTYIYICMCNPRVQESTNGALMSSQYE